MGREVLKIFDRYFLLDRIAQGGMAEIFRSRLASADGGSRFVVIKRIQAGFDENKDFLKMFRSEIKVMLGFNHPNIVQLYDFGEVQSQPFIAMELIDGRNLRQLIVKFTEQGQSFPIELAVSIIEHAAAGLHYAHCFKDKMTGEPMNIIHRDVSPQNIIVSYDGNVKLIDFGIAKASNSVDSTRVGIIKGKPSYLSPEQVSGRPVDRRSDLFSLGTVFWETLTGRKLFSKEGENEFAVLKLIENCQKHIQPPSKYNGAIPEELDRIVMRALTKEPERRFQTAEEMQRALKKFLNTIAPEFSASDLSFAVKNAFKSQIIEDRRWLKKLNEKAEQLLLTQRNDPALYLTAPNKDGKPQEREDPTFIQKKKVDHLDDTGSSNRLDLSVMNEAKVEVDGSIHTQSGNSLRRTRTAVARPRPVQKKSLPLGSLFVWGLSFLVVIAVTTGDSRILFDLKNRVFRYQSETAVTRDPSSTSVAKEAVVATSIVLNLVLPDGPGRTEIRVNGVTLPLENPRARVPLGKAFQITVVRDRFVSYKKEMILDPKEYAGLKEWSFQVPLEPVEFGYLTLYTTPSAQAYVIPLDNRNRPKSNETWMLNTPIENYRIPSGRYRLDLKNTVLGMEKSFSIEVKNGRKIKKDIRLNIK